MSRTWLIQFFILGFLLVAGVTYSLGIDARVCDWATGGCNPDRKCAELHVTEIHATPTSHTVAATEISSPSTATHAPASKDSLSTL